MPEWIAYRDLDPWVAERAPLRMVDRLRIDCGTRTAVGIKAVSIGEPYFQGHFPGSPIMPGVLQVAAMIQTGAALVRACTGVEGVPRCTALRRVKFRNPVVPGDRLRIEVGLEEDASSEDQFVVKASVLKGDTRASQGEIHLTTRPAAVTAEPDDTDEMLAAAEREEGEGEGEEGGAAGLLDVREIMEVIPHRFPFLLVDRLLHMDAEAGRVVGVKNVSGNEPFFAGVREPVVPPFLLPEIAAQVGCVLALCQPGNADKLGYFMSIDNAEFHSPVRPGDTLLVRLRVEGRGRFGRADAELRTGSRIAAVTELKFAVVDREE